MNATSQLASNFQTDKLLFTSFTYSHYGNGSPGKSCIVSPSTVAFLLTTFSKIQERQQNHKLWLEI